MYMHILYSSYIYDIYYIYEYYTLRKKTKQILSKLQGMISVLGTTRKVIPDLTRIIELVPSRVQIISLLGYSIVVLRGVSKKINQTVEEDTESCLRVRMHTKRCDAFTLTKLVEDIHPLLLRWKGTASLDFQCTFHCWRNIDSGFLWATSAEEIPKTAKGKPWRAVESGIIDLLSGVQCVRRLLASPPHGIRSCDEYLKIPIVLRGTRLQHLTLDRWVATPARAIHLLNTIGIELPYLETLALDARVVPSDGESVGVESDSGGGRVGRMCYDSGLSGGGGSSGGGPGAEGVESDSGGGREGRMCYDSGLSGGGGSSGGGPGAEVPGAEGPRPGSRGTVFQTLKAFTLNVHCARRYVVVSEFLDTKLSQLLPSSLEKLDISIDFAKIDSTFTALRGLRNLRELEIDGDMEITCLNSFGYLRQLQKLTVTRSFRKEEWEDPDDYDNHPPAGFCIGSFLQCFPEVKILTLDNVILTDSDFQRAVNAIQNMTQLEKLHVSTDENAFDPYELHDQVEEFKERAPEFFQAINIIGKPNLFHISAWDTKMNRKAINQFRGQAASLG
jgi:hypothetical protein